MLRFGPLVVIALRWILILVFNSVAVPYGFAVGTSDRVVPVLYLFTVCLWILRFFLFLSVIWLIGSLGLLPVLLFVFPLDAGRLMTCPLAGFPLWLMLVFYAHFWLVLFRCVIWIGSNRSTVAHGLSVMGSGGPIGLFLFSYLLLMSNMSYCRFQNTLGDLEDCVRFMDDNSNLVYDILDGKSPDPLSDDELDELTEDEDLLRDYDENRAMRDLVTLCEDIVRGYSVDYELTSIEKINPDATQPG